SGSLTLALGCHSLPGQDQHAWWGTNTRWWGSHDAPYRCCFVVDRGWAGVGGGAGSGGFTPCGCPDVDACDRGGRFAFVCVVGERQGEVLGPQRLRSAGDWQDDERVEAGGGERLHRRDEGGGDRHRRGA